MKTTQKQIQALRAICDTLIPGLEGDEYWRRKASDFGTTEKIIEQIRALSLREQKEFSQLLQLISSPLLGLTWWGPLKGAHKLNTSQIEKLLLKWAVSPNGQLRKSYNTLKKLSGLICFGAVENGENPNWAALNYQPIEKPASVNPAKLNFLKLDGNQTPGYDVIVVGSGAGGGVVAAELAKAGQKVLIIEKGKYYPESSFHHYELESYNKLYEGRGLLTSADGGITAFAGSCLGGGTTVNWAGAFRTPDYILEEWAKAHGNPHFLDPEYAKGFTEIEQRNSVSTDLIKHNPQNESLFAGAKKLAYQVKVIPRNVRKNERLDPEIHWKSQGFSPFGDAYGSKQSSLKIQLADACAANAEILCQAEVKKVLIKNGEATGVAVRLLENEEIINIRAKKVVLCAGSIHTPAILKRSGLQHREIGKNLYLHPVVAVSGLYDQPSFPWYGPMMSAVCDEFTRLDGNYGVKIETPPVHPGLMAAVLSWENGRQFKTDLLEAYRTRTFIVLTRDKFGGEIRLGKTGEPIIHYRLHDYDKKHLIRGMIEASRIHRAQDAEKISVYHNQPLHYSRKEASFDHFLQKIPGKKWNYNYFNLFTAHQMGTCRMGGSNERHPLKPDGETRAVKNLFVADGSAFPSASGANPMLSIQALAYYVAQQMKLK